jgi:hypothetical protein
MRIMRVRTVLQKARRKTYFRMIYRYQHSICPVTTVHILKLKEVLHNEIRYH